MQIFSNNATGVLAGAITAAAGSLTLQAGQGARFPALAGGDFFLVTLFQLVSGIETNYEIVKVTAIGGDVLTIARAQEGTTARAYGVGDQVSMRATAGTMTGFAQKGMPVTFTAPVAVPNVGAGDNTTNAANTAFVTTAVSSAVANLVNSSPAALDTLKELADAIGDDPNYAATMTAALGNRLRVDVNTQGLTAQQKTNAATNLGLAAVATSGSFPDLGNKPTTLGGYGITDAQASAGKDASGGYVGKTNHSHNFWNTAGTFMSAMQNAATAARTYTFPDKSITIAGTTNETHVNPTIKNYVEQLQTVTSGAAVTLDPTLGTLIVVNVSANTTITLPAVIAGASYTVILNYQGAFSATFTGGTAIKWAGGTAPAASSTNGKMDKYVFTCTATATLGQDAGRNF